MYEAALKSAEVMDAVIRDGKEVPKPLLAYVGIALFSFDDLFKKHERDQARNNTDIPYLHWQTIFPTNLLSSWD